MIVLFEFYSRQLSSLSRHAEEMFGNLFKEAEAVASRSSNIQARIDRLAIRVTQLDSTVEEGKLVIFFNLLHIFVLNKENREYILKLLNSVRVPF